MKIGILTRIPGYTARRLREEARLRGHEAVNIIFPECYVELESDHPTVHYRGAELDDFDVIIPRIMPVNRHLAFSRQIALRANPQ